MKQLFNDIIGFTKSLTEVDLLLYFAVVVLIILVVSLIYIIKTSDDEEEVQKATMFNEEDIDLKEVVTNIETTKPPVVEFTSYEEEQEEKAIISYDELISKSKLENINYDEEKVINDEVSVKKIALDHITNSQMENEVPRSNSLFNYEKEEAFLKTLQALNELLN